MSEKVKASAIYAEAFRLEAEVAALREALRRYGRHLGACGAFPATSEEQIAHDCDCGLQAALVRNQADAPRSGT